jgi:hypothetical protein
MGHGFHILSCGYISRGIFGIKKEMAKVKRKIKI